VYSAGLPSRQTVIISVGRIRGIGSGGGGGSPEEVETRGVDSNFGGCNISGDTGGDGCVSCFFCINLFAKLPKETESSSSLRDLNPILNIDVAINY